MEFGPILRSLRYRNGIGIKKLAPELGVTYGYLSKLENAEAQPSEEFVHRVASYFNYDSSELLLAAGRVPPDVVEILRNHPHDALDYLRTRFGKGRTEQDG
jgi:transcriptional regulator with XRE-family HTH domain